MHIVLMWLKYDNIKSYYYYYLNLHYQKLNNFHFIIEKYISYYYYIENFFVLFPKQNFIRFFYNNYIIVI